jgi:hypothetical protein
LLTCEPPPSNPSNAHVHSFALRDSKLSEVFLFLIVSGLHYETVSRKMRSHSPTHSCSAIRKPEPLLLAI